MFEVLISKKSKKLEDESKKAGFGKTFFIDGEKAVLIKTDRKEELRRQISSASSKGKKIIVYGNNDDINRISVEDKRVAILLSPEFVRNKDFMHYPNSGLNQVLCKLAKKNGIAIGVSFSDIKSLKGKEKSERLGRIMQNVDLCRKYKNEIVLASFGKKPSSPYALRSFGFLIGMTTDQLKESLENAERALS